MLSAPEAERLPESDSMYWSNSSCETLTLSPPSELEITSIPVHTIPSSIAMRAIVAITFAVVFFLFFIVFFYSM